MKGFLVLFTLAVAASALAPRSEIVPVHETKEWQDAYPNFAPLIQKNQNKAGRVWGGVVVENATVIPHQVIF